MATETKEFTFQDVAEHNTKNDAYMVIHDKVYDTSSFIDEHPYVPIPRATLYSGHPAAALLSSIYQAPVTLD